MRQKFLEQTQQKIVARSTALHGVFDLHRFFHDKGSGPLWRYVGGPLELLNEISEEIRQFQRTPEEGNALLASVFEWVATEIARPYHRALQKQERKHLRLVYDKNATSEPQK